MDYKHYVKKCLLLLLFIHLVTAEFHSLQYVTTGTTPGTSFPEYTMVGLVDGVQFVYYDSKISKMIPKTEWMEKNVGEEYWNTETQKQEGVQEIFKANLAILMERFGQTGGIHTLQRRCGCELDDDGSIRGYFHFSYDGEDFLSLDLNTLTWTAANAKALITKLKWEAADDAQYRKQYLENDCLDYLRKYIEFGTGTLERKVPPEVSLFQKDSLSPLVCHATGFYPKAVNITWKKNGEDLDEGVDLRETLPNQDGTFQRRSILTVSPEELNKHNYTCVVQHGGLDKEIVLPAMKRRVLHAFHSLQYVTTGIIETNFLTYNVVGMVDGEQFVHYNNLMKNMIPKTEWMKKEESQEYWHKEKVTQDTTEEIFRANLAILMERFNQTQGVHILQRFSGCELHDDGSVRGYFQYGYDGEDFLSLDLNTLTWTAANAKAVITKLKWEAADDAQYRKQYLENDCLDYLKKYLEYGRGILGRKVPPEISLFQKDFSSPVVCHATGFYPKAVTISWQKNGKDLDEGVELRETLPNQDGTFQKRSILTVSPEELDRNWYTCIIQHSSLGKELVLHVSDRRVLLGEESFSVISICVAVVAVLLLPIFCFGVYFYKKKTAFKPVSVTYHCDKDNCGER